MPGWRARLVAWRNSLIAAPAFQRAAFSIPFTRQIAQHRAARLFDLVAGFVYSQTLFACISLGVLPMLKAAPRTSPEIAQATGLSEDAAARLLRAAAALSLAESLPDGRFALGVDGAAFLAQPGLEAMVVHHQRLYADLADPVALLRGAKPGALADFWPYAGASDPGALGADAVAAYSALMAATQPAIAAQILGAVSFAGRRCLLDVCGGEGAFLEAVGRRWPHLDLILADLPPVAARAEARFAAEGMTDRVRLAPGDARREPLPRGADVATLVRVLHDHDDDSAAAILAAIRAALPRGGHLMIAEPLRGAGASARVGDAYFGLYLLAMGSGRVRSRQEHAALLAAAGFTAPVRRPVRMPLLTQVLCAKAR
ncbi:MAG: methyltransferase domain-containing protein [Alphaproteobacteria bacterium]|nr:methyltransferase domain-containing protein [Alphaproteobacteria bacterium]